jgi:subtilase family serine protease
MKPRSLILAFVLLLKALPTFLGFAWHSRQSRCQKNSNWVKKITILLTTALLTAVSPLAFAQPPRSATAAPRIVEPIDETNLVQQKGNTHPQARAEYDKGIVADSFPMQHIFLLLKRSPQQEAALQNFIDQLHDPSSANYHAWLTAEQLGSQFGPAQQDVETVKNWLRSHGFQVHRVYANGLLIDFSGTAGQVRDTFHTEIHQYNVNGAQHIANASDPKLPATLTAAVQGVISLNNFFPQPGPRNVGAVKRDATTGSWVPMEPQPTFSFAFNGNEYFFVGPQDFLKIYQVKPLWQRAKPVTGKGQTIAIISDSNMNPADWNTFRAAFGLSSFSGTLAHVHPAPSSGPNDCFDPGIIPNVEPETALDAEWSGVAAPDANIEVASCADYQMVFGAVIAALNLIDSANPPPIISVSFAYCESFSINFAALISALWQQAAAEGTSVIVGSADGGAAGCFGSVRDHSPATSGIGVSAFASTPYNLAVGGTDFSDLVDGTVFSYWRTTNSLTLESAKSYIPEIPWDQSCASSVLYTFFGYPSGNAFCNSAFGSNFLSILAGSGGPSAVHLKPLWQSGVIGIPNDGVRGIPDVSLFSSISFYTHALVWCVSDLTPCVYSNPNDAFFSAGGGTSFAAPAFAGIQALINQITASRQGNPNYVLYRLAAAEYGSNNNPNPGNLANCNSAMGSEVGGNCIFHDITRGNNDVVCTAGSPNCYALPGDAYGVLSTSSGSLGVAFPATPGWDFATGLGSINVTNLVTAWPK